jgi:hypothetical protein
VSVGPNLNISEEKFNQIEAAIAVNPTNPSNIVAVSMDENISGSLGYFFAYTTDGGQTWKTRHIATGNGRVVGGRGLVGRGGLPAVRGGARGGLAERPPVPVRLDWRPPPGPPVLTSGRRCDPLFSPPVAAGVFPLTHRPPPR